MLEQTEHEEGVTQTIPTEGTAEDGVVELGQKRLSRDDEDPAPERVTRARVTHNE